MIKKLFSIEYGQWEKALSYETTDFVGGIFKQFTNCDPFDGQGAFVPVNDVNEIGNGVIDPTKAIRKIMPVYASAGPGQFYVLADDYKLYLVDTNETVTDKSAEITTGTSTAIDMIVWKGGLVYAYQGGVRANAIPVASASDVSFLACTPTSNLCIGPDRYLYVGISNNVGKMTDDLTDAVPNDNTATVAASLESGNIVRKLLTDGRYLVWIADNGTSPSGKSLSTIAWWNLASSTFDQIFQFEGGVVLNGEKIGTVIKILTSKGIWHTNFSTEPFLAIPFGGTVAGGSTADVPVNFFAAGSMGKHKGNFVFWGAQQSATGKIYAIGNKLFGKQDRLFQMGTSPQVSVSAIASNDAKFVAAAGTLNPSAGVKLYNLRGSASLSTAIANVAGFSLKGKTYTFHSARVILKSPISSGNSVSLQILTANSTKTILATSAKTNSTDSGERNLVFDHVAAGDGSDVRAFEDISDIKLTTNVAVNSLEIWGEETDARGSYG